MGIVSEIYEGGGGKPVSWEEVGQTVEGEIIGIRSKQLTKFGTEVPETWEDGSPKHTPIVTVQLESGFDDDDSSGREDDGKRDIYLRSNAYTAFGKALRESFKAKPEDSDLIGCILKIQFYKTEKSGKGQPRKLYRARITRKASTAAGEDDGWATSGQAAPARASNPPTTSSSPARPATTPPPARHPVDDDIPF